MTKTLTLFLLLVSSFSFAQMPVNADGKVEYSEVVQVDSSGAQRIYSRAKLFIAGAFVSGKAATQMNDDAAFTTAVNGALRGIIGLGSLREGFVSFKLAIQCKDGRYKYSFTDFIHEGAQYAGGRLENDKPDCGTFFLPKKQWEKLKAQTDATIRETIEKMKKTLQSAATNDW